jgi:lysozyme
MEGISIIKRFEGCKLRAYLCPGSVWTIGWGSTFYEDGSRVREGDRITQDRADLLLMATYRLFEAEVRRAVTARLTPNQLGALVSFTFNVGGGNLRRSTLLRLVNQSPNNPGIRAQFMRWNKAGGVVLRGLTRRREAEANLYFKA